MAGGCSVRPKYNLIPKAVKAYTGDYKTVDEYTTALRTWMLKIYQMQCVSASFPYYLATIQAQVNIIPNGANQPQQPPAYVQPQTGNQPDSQNVPAPLTEPLPRRGVEYAIPSIGKRVAAEALDFFLLFIIKLGVTFLAMDSLDLDLLQEINKYDFETLGTDFMSDYQLALSMTSEILLLELIHRIGTCIFEALCLHRGPGGIGGATPGKRIMGLRVVRCEWVAPSRNNYVLVYPSSNIGFGRAVLRSVVKNFSLTFLFPICFTLFSFQHNRTIYDIMAGSIVVEERTRVANNPAPN